MAKKMTDAAVQERPAGGDHLGRVHYRASAPRARRPARCEAGLGHADEDGPGREARSERRFGAYPDDVA